MTQAGDLRERYAFDQQGPIEMPGGVTAPGWTQQHACRAQVIYARGSETVEAARLEGRPIYKLRIRQCAAARGITTDARARDLRRGLEYAVIEVDSITDPAWIYLVIEGGKAA